MDYDVIVIGGGLFGFMVVISVVEKNKWVLLIEKGLKLGCKLIMFGGGCCNVMNRWLVEEIIKYIFGNGCFLYSVFYVFDNEDIICFFERFGVVLKEEDYGRMFFVLNSVCFVVEVMI